MAAKKKRWKKKVANYTRVGWKRVVIRHQKGINRRVNVWGAQEGKKGNKEKY